MLRAGLRWLFLLTFWMSAIPCLLWSYTYAEFFFVQPARAQNELFGRQIAGITSLRGALNDCCLIPMGDGLITWTYEMDEDMARGLAQACAGRHPERVQVLDRAAGLCRLEKTYKGYDRNEGGFSASLVGNRLTISQEWM